MMPSAENSSELRLSFLREKEKKTTVSFCLTRLFKNPHHLLTSMPMKEKVADPKGIMWRNIESTLIAYSVFCEPKLFATILGKLH